MSYIYINSCRKCLILWLLVFLSCETVLAMSLQPDSTKITHKVMILSEVEKPQLKPQRVRQMNNAGVGFGNRKAWHNAQNIFQKAIEGTTDNDTLIHNFALTQGFLKNYEQALDLQARTNLGRRYLQNKGTLHAQMGDVEKGIEIWNQAPRTDTLCFNLAVAYYRKQNLDEALNWSRGFGFSKNNLFHELYANVLYRQGKYKESQKFYEKSEKIEPSLRLLVQRGNAHLVQKEYDKAEELFNEYLASKHSAYRFQARLGLGHVFYRKRQFQAAVFEYDAACLLKDNSIEAWTSLGNAYLGTEGNRQAQKAFERAIDLDRSHKPAWLGLAVVFYRIHNYGESLCAFGEADSLLNPKDRDHADLYAIRGFCKLYMGQNKASKPDIDLALRLQPKGLLPLIAMSEFLRIEQYFLSSLKYLDRAIKFNVAANVKMLVNRGNIYLKCREYEDAYADFAKARELEFGNVNACNGLAITWINQNQIDRAKAMYDSLLKKKNVAMLLNNRGIAEGYMALRSRQERDETSQTKFERMALRDFEKGLEVDSTKNPYHVNIGNIYKGQNLDNQAIEEYQKHLSKNAINNLGVLYAKSPRKDYATHYLNIAINLDTSNTIYRYNRAKAYRDNFKGDFLRRPDFQQDFKNAPVADISMKYSPDGFVTIFLFDYESERFEFPGEPLMEVRPEPIDDFNFLLAPDFVTMHGDGAAPLKGISESYEVSDRPNRYKAVSIFKRGKTSCPKIY